MGALFFESMSIQFLIIFPFAAIFTACKLKHFLLVFKNCYFFMLFHNNSGVKEGIGHIYNQSKGRGYKTPPFLITPSMVSTFIEI